jgi:hypothetical protein
MNQNDWRSYFYSDAQLVTCAVAVKFNAKAEFLGSAVYIAPGLFVTAKHVIEDPFTRVGIMKEIHENKKFGQFDADMSTDEFILEVVQFPKLEAKVAQRWNIHKTRFSHDYDFAVILADSTDGPIKHLVSTLPIVPINIHPIPKSPNVISAGFFGKSEKVDDITTSHDMNFTSRPGKLVNFHLDHASVAGSAVYEVDNKIEHMMSGGPVFNHEGSVIAVNSSGIYDEDKNRTIVTPFIRGMFMEFDYPINGVISKTSMYDLAQRGIIKVIGFEHLSQDDDHIVWSPNSNCKYCYPLKEK